MPLFGKRDDAENRFKEAKRYADLSKVELDVSKKELNLDTAIRLLEEAVMLKPDKKQYGQKLDEIRQIKAKIITSSTSRHPIPKDVYLFLLSELEKGGDFVTFQHQDESRYVQILFAEGEQTLVNFAYPYDEDPNRLIFQRGISFPSGYVLSEWDPEINCTFAGPGCPHSELADTIDVLFTKLLGAPSDYVVKGCIEE